MTSPDSHLARILHDLGSAFPHPVEQVRVVQTHVSCVFLTGDFAYKVKKPVRFAFLDYSTLDRRRELCQKELELNRRLCPDVYLDVLPLVEDGGRLRIGGSGPAVEWTLRMRQLSEADMLPARLASRTVGEDTIASIGRALSVFHARSEHGERLRPFGEPAAVEPVVTNALPNEKMVADGVVTARAASAIETYLRGICRQQADRLRERMDGGAIRDCHGDLRIQNICLDPRFGGLQIFDCIEFNDRFRFIDVASDLAYLTMDLDLAGRADLRWLLVETYQQAAADPGLSSMLDLYRCYRACVQGQIGFLAAQEPEVPGAERKAHRAVAMAAYDLAHSYASPRGKPVLFVLVGYSGSGKSTRARELARRMPAVLLTSDRIRKELAGQPGTRLDQPYYTAEARSAVYEMMRQRASEWIGKGENVLLDATFLDRAERRRTELIAREAGADFRLLECRCPNAIIRERLRSREQAAQGVSDAGLAVYEQQRQQYPEPLLTGPERQSPATCSVDMTLPPDEVARWVLEWLDG